MDRQQDHAKSGSADDGLQPTASNTAPLRGRVGRQRHDKESTGKNQVSPNATPMQTNQTEEYRQSIFYLNMHGVCREPKWKQL